MKVNMIRKSGVLVCNTAGRLDGYGAQQLKEALDREIEDDDRAVVIDLSATDYLSSAGIRVFLALMRRLKERSGSLALAGLGDYPAKVLEIAGFTTVFSIFETADAAVRRMSLATPESLIIQEPVLFSAVRDGAGYRFESASSRPAALKVTGNLQAVLYARIGAGDLKAVRFSDIEYSLGLGALGPGPEDVLPFLGEMITLHGSMTWLPTDGHHTPDFLSPVRDSDDVMVYTAYDVALEGQFQEVVGVDASETGDRQGITLGALYQALFEFAATRRKDYRGVIAVAMWAVTGGVRSSGVRRSPVTGSLPEGASIMDPGFVNEWMDADNGPQHQGGTLVSFGYGIDVKAASGHFSPEALSSVMYHNPLNPDSAGVFLHNHGVVFSGIPWDESRDPDTTIKKIVTQGEFVDMRHLLDNTRIRRARLGVAYISGIRPAD